jgi:hypothetical protein
MKIRSYLQSFLIFTFITTFIFLSGCNNDPVTTSSTDDDYLRNEALQQAYSSNDDDDDNLLANEVLDFDASGAVEDDGGSPYDSLLRWGRTVVSTTLTVSFVLNTDTLKTLEVKRTISGNFVVVGYIGLALDSVSKPYTQEQRRLVTFKRVGRNANHPRLNWRLYQYTAVDGQTTAPQLGKSNITISKIEFFKNDGTFLLVLNGPDFTSNVFRAKHFFNAEGMLRANRNDNVKCKVYLNSNQSDTDYVAFHWARNTFGYHRVPFTMISQVQNGGTYDRVYEKTFTIYGSHRVGIFNGFLSANTRASLWNNNVDLFSSTYAGFAYRILN